MCAKVVSSVAAITLCLFCSLGLRSQLDSCPDANSKGRIIVGATTTNGDTESTTSGNSSASNSSGGPLKNVQLRIKASNNKSQAQGRPNSLLTDRALLSRVPGLNKVFCYHHKGHIWSWYLFGLIFWFLKHIYILVIFSKTAKSVVETAWISFLRVILAMSTN